MNVKKQNIDEKRQNAIVYYKYVTDSIYMLYSTGRHQYKITKLVGNITSAPCDVIDFGKHCPLTYLLNKTFSCVGTDAKVMKRLKELIETEEVELLDFTNILCNIIPTHGMINNFNVRKLLFRNIDTKTANGSVDECKNGLRVLFTEHQCIDISKHIVQNRTDRTNIPLVYYKFTNDSIYLLYKNTKNECKLSKICANIKTDPCDVGICETCNTVAVLFDTIKTECTCMLDTSIIDDLKQMLLESGFVDLAKVTRVLCKYYDYIETTKLEFREVTDLLSETVVNDVFKDRTGSDISEHIIKYRTRRISERYKPSIV